MRILFLLVAFLSGCSFAPVMNDQVQEFNAAQEAKFEPTRARYTKLKGGAFSLEFGIWAGVPGETAANEVYKRKILDGFKSQCGFEESALKEVRVVRHEAPIWYEVWVFNNPLSKRPDKTSGMSVVMNYNQSTNITNVSFHGSCK